MRIMILLHIRNFLFFKGLEALCLNFYTVRLFILLLFCLLFYLFVFKKRFKNVDVLNYLRCLDVLKS